MGGADRREHRYCSPLPAHIRVSALSVNACLSPGPLGRDQRHAVAEAGVVGMDVV